MWRCQDGVSPNLAEASVGGFSECQEFLMSLLSLFLYLSGTVLAQEVFHFERIRNTEVYMTLFSMKRET